MPKTRASVLMWRIKLPFVKVDRIHDLPCKIGVVQARADQAGGVSERDSARRPGRPLACSTGYQILGTAQGKTLRDSQLSGRMERATQ